MKTNMANVVVLFSLSLLLCNKANAQISTEPPPMQPPVDTTIITTTPSETATPASSTETTVTTVSTAPSVAPVTDEQITGTIKNKFAVDKITSELNLNVTTSNGIVFLSGEVNTIAEALQAIEIAESTPGVKDTVINQLTVRATNLPFNDGVITAKVRGTFTREQLVGDKTLSMMNINVDTRDGIVFLTGAVESKEQIERAVVLARTVDGVLDVDSKLTIQAPPTTGPTEDLQSTQPETELENF